MSTTTTLSSPQFVSFPIKSARTGDLVRYRPLVSEAGATITLTSGPSGAAIGTDGALTWTPTASQSGAQAFVLHAVAGTTSIDQKFTIQVAKLTVQASQAVDPANPNGGAVTVDEPLSPIHGSGVVLPPGALAAGAPVTISISSVENAPVPTSATLSGVAATDLLPIELGPSGTAFGKPVTLYVPVSQAVLAKGTPEVQTYDFTTGTWQQVPVVSVDTVNGVVVAQASHFSLYVAAPPAKFLNIALNLGAGTAVCGQSLEVQAPLAQKFAQIPATAVNGAPAGANTLADVVAALPVGAALETYITLDASTIEGKSQSAFQVLAATRIGPGKLQLFAATDSNPGPLWNTPIIGDADVETWLNGSRIASVFGSLGAATSQQVTVTGTVSFFVAPGGFTIPNGQANALGSDTQVATMLTPTTTPDSDCDGIPDAYDPQPTGSPPPQLIGMPGPQVQVPLGIATHLAVQANGTATFAWSASDPSVQLVVDPSGSSASATAHQLGVFHVQVVATQAGATSVWGWNLIVLPMNTMLQPPHVVIAASNSSVRVGDTVALMAIGFDPQQAQLSFAWSCSPGGALVAGTGPSATLNPTSAGDYNITVVASDGMVNSPPFSLPISVLPAGANRPPNAPIVNQPYVLVQHSGTTIPSVTINANATDPDGDMVTYEFSIDPAASTAPATLTSSGATATFTATADGFYAVYVLARDTSGAASPWTYVKIQVTPTIPNNPVDNDGDGYPVPIDCNDNDPTIHPGAVEICGDNIDQDCNGSDLSPLDCDTDKDHFSVRAGDCNDNDPSISPGVVELCDGKDNNCNGQIDEGYQTGGVCTAGTGACQASGAFVCNAAHNGSTCSATEKMPTPEVCDGIDNDCDGIVDDVSGTATGTLAMCGSCNMACAAPAHTAPACLKGGCIAPCAPPFVDANNDPSDGCECQPTNGGVEICDGIDNDCNGLVDDNVTAIVYSGPAGTLGVGPCRAGVSTCKAGVLVPTIAEIDPTTEICDGIDNNCNGKIDDGFDFQNDNGNCGGCGDTCMTGNPCTAGKCVGQAPFDMVFAGDLAMSTPDFDKPRDMGGSTKGPDMGTSGCSTLLTACSTGCAFTSDDPKNCGGCDKVCGANQVCVSSSCVTAGTGGYGATCNASTDCAGGEVCLDNARTGWSGGFCTTWCTDGSCGAGQVCNNVNGGDGPVACETKCGADTDCTPLRKDFVCSQGICEPSCQENTAICANGSTCDPTGHCVFPAGNDMGTSCAPPFSPCSTGVCRLLSDDPANCGACGHVCGTGLVCSNGSCAPAGTGTVGSSCTGNTSCGGGEVCLDPARTGFPTGMCTTTCDSTMCSPTQTCSTLFGDSASRFCLNTCKADPDCGTTGLLCSANTCRPSCLKADVCPDGTTCLPDGHCGTATSGGDMGSFSCPAPFAPCGNTCRLMTDDPANCGACGKTCGAAQVCENSACVAAGSGAFGASCKLNTDCGSGEICLDQNRTGFPNGMCSTVCDTTGCTGPGPEKCQPLFGDTTSSFCLNQCNVDTDCGTGLLCSLNVCRPSCTKYGVCPDGSSCQADGHCGASTCGTGLTSCNGMCTNTQSDPSNCGTCGNACPTGMCSSGMCTSGQSCSNGQQQGCYDGTPATLNVGACKSGTEICMAGKYGACQGEVLPTPEICGDGIDNDCNGIVDDNCALAVTPSNPTVAISATLKLTATGGTSPYTYTLDNNQSGGNVDAQGNYTAGTNAGMDQVTVRDAKGTAVSDVINVVTSPFVTLSPPSQTTNQQKLIVMFSTLVGATADWTLDGADQGAVPVDSNGNGTVFPFFMTEGTHTVVLNVTTSLGTASATGTYIVDLTPPNVPTITSPATGSTASGPTVLVNASIDPTTQQLSLTDFGQSIFSIPTGGASAAMFQTPALVTGDHVLAIIAQDAAGNASEPSTAVVVTVTNGNAAPLSVITNGTGAAANGTQTIYAQGGTPPYSFSLATNATGGSITPAGVYMAGTMSGTDVIQVTDATNATATGSIVVQPSFFVTILSPANGATVTTSSIQLQLEGTNGATANVLVDGIAQVNGVPLKSESPTPVPINFAASGQHMILVNASGPTGTASTGITVTYQSSGAGSAPQVIVNTPSPGQIVQVPFPVLGKTTPNIQVQVIIDGMPVGAAPSAADGSFNLQVTNALTMGNHTLQVIANDPVNGTGQSQPISINVM